MAVTPTYIPLGTITLASTDSEIIFSSIPATYRDLILIANLTHTTASRYATFTVNGDNGSNYNAVQMFGTGSGSGTSAAYSSGTRFVFNNNVFEVTTEPVFAQIQFLDYSATDKHKSCVWRAGQAGVVANASAGRYASLTAISSISILATAGGANNFAIGSTFSLYGVN